MPLPATDLFSDSCASLALVDLRKFVRYLIDGLQEGPDQDLIPDPEWSDDVVNMAVNMAYAALAQEQVMSFEGDFLSEQEFPIGADGRTIQLPGDLFKVDRIALRVGGDWYPLNYTSSPWDPDYGMSSAYWFFLPEYRFSDHRTIVFNPVFPTNSEARFKVRWYRLPKCISGMDDTPDPAFLRVWHWLVVLDAAIICKAKDDGDASELERIRAKHYYVFRNAIEQRSPSPRFVEAFWPEGYGA